MPFCTCCGTRLDGAAKFCPQCGKSLGPNPGPVLAEIPAALDYEIHGDNLQLVRVRLKPGQELYAEAGKMVYKTAAVAWETKMTGQTLGEKIWGAVKRKLAGESLFLTYFRAAAEGEVGFAGNYPGRIQVFQLAPAQSILVQRDSFLCAQSTVQLTIALIKRLGAGLLGGEGFILEKLTGPGAVFIHGGGDFLEFNLAAAETLQIDTGCVEHDPSRRVTIRLTSRSPMTSSSSAASKPPSSAVRACSWPPSPDQGAPSSRA